MDYFSWMSTGLNFGGLAKNNQKPKDPNSNSALRGYEKRLEKLLVRELTPRRVKEIQKLHEKIAAQKEKIRKKNAISERPEQ